MSPPQLSPDLIISDLLTAWPQAIPVLNHYKMACAGCDMSGFETLGEAAQIYGIAVTDLLADLHAAIHPLTLRSTPHE